MLKVRKGGGEEIPLIQGKEQQLRFAGAAVKRYPTPKVRETQERWSVLQEGIRGQTHRNHTHRKLVNIITLGPQPCQLNETKPCLRGNPRQAGDGGEV